MSTYLVSLERYETNIDSIVMPIMNKLGGVYTTYYNMPFIPSTGQILYLDCATYNIFNVKIIMSTLTGSSPSDIDNLIVVCKAFYKNEMGEKGTS